MNLLDFIVILIFVFAFYRGFKKGAISSLVSLVGTLFIFIAAYFLKNPISELLYTYVPFNSFYGVFEGITSFNILLYEAVSYLLCLIILSGILNVVLKLTGIVDKVIKLTLVLTLPSKLLGGLFNTLKWYAIVFVCLFVVAAMPDANKYYNDSMLGKKILASTPMLSNITSDMYKAITEVYDICIKYEDKNADDKTLGDREAIDVMLKYNVVTPKSVRKMVEMKKIKISNVDELLRKYEG